MLTPHGCLERRKRLQIILRKRRCEGCFLSWHKHVYYFGGILPEATFPSAFLMDAEGDAGLILPFQPANASIPVKPYEWISMVRACDSRDAEFLRTVSRVLKGPCFRGVKRVAVDGGWLPYSVAEAFKKISPKVEIVDIHPDLLKVRRKKDPDEVDSIRESIRLIEAAYRRAKEVVKVGKTEIDVYHELSAAMDQAAGRSVALKGDFACGMRARAEGGPPTPRRIQSGDLYILDLFPEVDGYYGDLTRVFAAGPILPVQRKAWDCLVDAIESAEKIIEPGLPGRKLYEFIRRKLSRYKAAQAVFGHHAGHGLGLNHEHPRFTPRSDENLVEGSVFTLEPGLYGAALQGGLRIEHNYWLTAEGLQRLDHYPDRCE